MSQEEHAEEAPAEEPAEGAPAEESAEESPAEESAEEAPAEEPAEEAPAEEEAGDAEAPGEPGNTVTTASGLQYIDLAEGEGDAAEAGRPVSVHYTGWLTDGTKFDSSVDRNQSFQFNLGAGQVIAGWDEGVSGMKVGGKRKLTIPPELGYGAAGAGGVIPPGATLVFDVELLEIH